MLCFLSLHGNEVNEGTTADIHVIMKQLYKNSSGEASCATYCKQYNCEVNIHTQVKFANLYTKYVNVRCLIKQQF